jgi:N-acylneuraminate cytidylyltransferase
MIETLTAQDHQPIAAFVSVPPTSPLRAVEDIDACITTLLETDADVVITVRLAARSPYFNMVCLDQTGYARLVIPPEGTIHRRQATPLTYDITTVAYAVRPQFVLEANSLFAGKVRTVLVPEERALDIDTEFDLRIADFLLNERSAHLCESQAQP